MGKQLCAAIFAVLSASAVMAASDGIEWTGGNLDGTVRDGFPNLLHSMRIHAGWSGVAVDGPTNLKAKAEEYGIAGLQSAFRFNSRMQWIYPEYNGFGGGVRYIQYGGVRGFPVYGGRMSHYAQFICLSDDDLAEGATVTARALEGTLRQMAMARSYSDRIVIYLPTPELVNAYRDGAKCPLVEAAERVADHYGVASVNLAQAVAAGRRPIDALKAFVAAAAEKNRAAWADPKTDCPRIKLPEKLDTGVGDRAQIVAYDTGVAKFGQDWLGWQRPPCEPFFHVLVSKSATASLELPFKGTEVGLVDVAASDMAPLEWSVDGGAWTALPPTGATDPVLRHTFCASGLKDAEHVFRLRVAGSGTARIGAFLVNGTVANPFAGMGVLARRDEMYRKMGAIRYAPPAGRFEYIPETIRRLREGGTLNLVMLGDSIVNDTSSSGFEQLLMRNWPKCKIRKTTSVRGSTGCDWYREKNRVDEWVLKHRPDFLMIGGVSHKDPWSVRDVVRQVRAKSPKTEIMLLTPVFGSTSCEWNKNWTREIDESNTNSWRTIIRRIAKEEKCAFFDMTGPLNAYVNDSGKAFGAYMRDQVHANERGQILLGRLLERWFGE